MATNYRGFTCEYDPENSKWYCYDLDDEGYKSLVDLKKAIDEYLENE